MANNRNLRLVKKSDTKKDTDYEKRILRHYRINFLKILGVIISIVIAVAVFYTQMTNKIYTTYSEVSANPLSLTSATQTLVFQDKLLFYTNDGMRCVDSKGKDLWNQAYEMQNPIVKMCEDVVAVGDYKGRKLFVMNGQGSMGEIDTSMPITTFCVAATGEVAAVLEDSGITWIYLYDTQGNTIAYMKTSMDKSGYPLAVSLSPNGALLQVSYLYADNGVLKSSVAFYNFGEVGQDSIDKYVSGYDYTDNVVPIVQFMDDSHAFAVADSRLMFYSGSQKPTSAAEVLLGEEIQAVYYSEKYVALTYLNQSSEAKYLLDIYNTSGTKVMSLAYDMECIDILLDKDTVVLYDNEQCQVYNMNGVKKFEGIYETGIRLIVPTTNSFRYTIVTADAIKGIQLK